VIIAVVNNKGGVGKTTTAVNLGAALASPRRRVLLVDLDSQASASMWCGVDRGRLKPSIASCLIDTYPLRQAIRATGVEHLDLVTGSVELANIDLALGSINGRELALKQLLHSQRPRYDTIVLDCPPGFSLTAINALVAADALIVPVTPNYLAAEGLGNLLTAIDTVHSRFATKARLLGVLLTIVDVRRKAAEELRERLRAQHRERMFHTEIAASPVLEDAPAAAKTIFQFAPRSAAADAFHRLAGEVLDRLRAAR
jgi:chromosome partitioning protein